MDEAFAANDEHEAAETIDVAAYTGERLLVERQDIRIRAAQAAAPEQIVHVRAERSPDSGVLAENLVIIG